MQSPEFFLQLNLDTSYFEKKKKVIFDSGTNRLSIITQIVQSLLKNTHKQIRSVHVGQKTRLLKGICAIMDLE